VRAEGEQSAASFALQTGRRECVVCGVLRSQCPVCVCNSQECEVNCTKKEKWRSRRCSPFSPFAPTSNPWRPNVLCVACAKVKADGPDGELEAERLRHAGARATAHAYCESLPDYCDRARCELERLRGMAVSRRGEGSCVCARVQIGSNGEATLNRRCERR